MFMMILLTQLTLTICEDNFSCSNETYLILYICNMGLLSISFEDFTNIIESLSLLNHLPKFGGGHVDFGFQPWNC